MKKSSFEYKELPADVQKIALQNLIDWYWNDDAVDTFVREDPYLFEIKITDRNEKFTNDVLLDNNCSDNLSYSKSKNNSFLNINKNLIINDYLYFYIWLGLTEKTIEKIKEGKIEMRICGDATLFETSNLQFFTNVNNVIKEKTLKELNSAIEKFNKHILTIKERIDGIIQYTKVGTFLFESEIIKEYEFSEEGDLII